MGYYSEVSLTIYENDYKKLLLAAKLRTDINIKNLLIKYSETKRTNNIITILWHSIKWYPYFPEVEFIENYLRSGIEYCFRKVGEDVGDIETRYNNDDWSLCEKTDIITEILSYDAGDDINTEEYFKAIENGNEIRKW